MEIAIPQSSRKGMFLLQLLLASIGISHVDNASPPWPIFQQLLNTCTKPEYTDSTQCQYFFSTYPWQNENYQTAFNQIICTRIESSSAWNSLTERLIHFIENPNFDLSSLGKRSFHYAVWHNNEPLAIAIWPYLDKYDNDPKDLYTDSPRHIADLQLFECYWSLPYILNNNMLHLLNRMVTDQPDCLLQSHHIMDHALRRETNRATREFLVDHGLEIKLEELEYWNLSLDGFEWALLHYRKSNVLIENSIRNGNQVVAIAILEFLKHKNYNDQLFQICNDTVFDVVKSNKVELLKSIFRYFPNNIFSIGDTLIDIAINGGNCTPPMIQLLNLYAVKIAPNLQHKAESLGYNGKYDRSILDSQLSTLTQGLTIKWEYTDIVSDFFKKAVEENKKELDKIEEI